MTLLPTLGTGIVGQLLKLLFHSLRQRRWRRARLADFESFPSLHPLLAGALCFQVAEAAGWKSPEAAVAMGFTSVILYDTAGVKRAAGRQAGILMRLGPRQSLDYRLTELMGQSPVRTYIALLSGMLISVLIERGWLAMLRYCW
jgi:hypothetical protein